MSNLTSPTLDHLDKPTSAKRRETRPADVESRVKLATTRYDIAEHLRTQEEMAAYLEACFEEANGDASFIAKALGDIARARGMAQVARDAGLSRESLYKALSGERSPGFDTVLKVMGALGLKLSAQPNDASPISGHPENIKHSGSRSADKKFHSNATTTTTA